MEEKIEQLIENILEDYGTWRICLKNILEKHLKSLQEPIEFSGEIEDFKSLWYKVTEKDIIELYKEKHLQ
jgi:hypothetical protein